MQAIEAGPLRVEITQPGQPVSDDARFDAFPAWARDITTVEKLVARFSITANGEMLIGNVPFFYGSTDDVFEMADARRVWESVRGDLRSVASYTGSFEDAWPEWADDLGVLVDASSESIRASIAAFRQIRAWA